MYNSTFSKKKHKNEVISKPVIHPTVCSYMEEIITLRLEAKWGGGGGGLGGEVGESLNFCTKLFSFLISFFEHKNIY